ncbi:MAG: hypothetical protein KA319_01140 [Ferruginibacter sp.]|nr:hypothetical protein [Ferruginibacter sp.]
MKKIIIILYVVLINTVAFGQVAKPTLIAKPDKAILTHLQKIALSITENKSRGLDSNTKSFVRLLKTANAASTWKNAEYKSFIKQATIYIKALGIGYTTKDGGEKFSADPNDGGEIFASSKMLIKALNQICTNTICPICCCLFPTDCKGKVN